MSALKLYKLCGIVKFYVWRVRLTVLSLCWWLLLTFS